MACIAKESDGVSSIGLVAEVMWFSALNPPSASPSLGHLRRRYRVEQGSFRCCSMVSMMLLGCPSSQLSGGISCFIFLAIFSWGANMERLQEEGLDPGSILTGLCV